ncbi:hypothetical protein ACMT1E_02130 [Sphingomonas flavalba]|uniref:hypothetical protein n=1 Tax=Sphingomonas flavalba TaxID=2559804 RepID=UPI0039E17B09
MTSTTHSRGETRSFLSDLSYGLPIVAIAMRGGAESTVAASYGFLALFALFGRSQAIYALFLSWLFTMVSEGVAPEGGGGVGRYVVILGVALSAGARSWIFSSRARPSSLLIMTILLGVFIVIHSIVYSSMPDVSISKAISWIVTMMAVISLWVGCSPEQRSRIAAVIFGGLTTILVVSLPLIALPLGYLVNGTGFQGVINHPQVMGSTAALVGTWAITRMLGERKPGWGLLAITVMSLAITLLSEARTAGLAMVLGVGFALATLPAFSGRSIASLAPGLFSARFFTIIWLGVIGAIAAAGAVADLIRNFLSKSGRAGVDGLLSAYDVSRGFLIDMMVINIRHHPFTGIGFGTPSVPGNVWGIDRDPIFGIPFGAPVEKGVAPLAVMEELGLFGAALVLCWLFVLLRGASRGSLAAFALCVVILTLNLGENTLFSPGGQGLLALVLLGWAYADGNNDAANGRSA